MRVVGGSKSSATTTKRSRVNTSKRLPPWFVTQCEKGG
jgi:hypothetical protein